MMGLSLLMVQIPWKKRHFLQSTINTFKPIVLCGSMRPSTAISSDGPMNLYQAIVIASNRKVVVVEF